MKVYVYPADQFACGHYRLIWPAEALAAQGMDVTVVQPGDTTNIGGVLQGDRMTSVFLPDGADVIVLQRPARRRLGEAVRLARRRGVAVVVDMDDDLERIHPSNPAFQAYHPSNPENNWRHVAQACRDATLVTCSTAALMPRFAPHGRVRLIPNYVPGRFLGLSVPSPLPSGFGWAGSLHSHPDDLDEPAGAIARLRREGHPFQIVGPPEGVAEHLHLEAGDQVPCTGNLPFDDWMPNVAQLGLGIAPLSDSSFNAAKSWLKPLEYSAVGVPWVASDRVEYRRLARLCGAPLVTKPKHWYREIKTLLDNPSRQADLGATAKEVAATLTIERHAHMWAEAWQEALHIERAKVAR